MCFFREPKPCMCTVHLFVLLVLLWFVQCINGDKPCAARYIDDRSVVCVCNATYCDEIIREEPASGVFIAYSSSESGLRFKKTRGRLQSYNPKVQYPILLELDPKTKYQTCEGFGGAVTDAAGIIWKSLPETMQQYLIDSYFSERGLEYNMARLPIGGCDFSTHEYAYNDFPKGDTTLSNFSLAFEDYSYKIPMLKAASAVAPSPIHIVATTWSPPMWMKDHLDFSSCGRLNKEYYQTYADYHYKFIEQYAAADVNIWAITTTNEPSNGFYRNFTFNCLGWTAYTMGSWIVNNLGPTIRGSTFKDVKILTCDDQRTHLPYWLNVLVDEQPEALDYIDGVAVHFYSDEFISATYLSEVSHSHPNKFILNTEACTGSFYTISVDLGSWDRARQYIRDILEDLNHNVVGWIDWNLCLDTTGGPNWVNNFVDSPIVVDAAKGEFIKQPMFYAMGHFSKFIPRGSRRIKVTNDSEMSDITNVAFLTTRGTIVVVLYNGGEDTRVAVKLGESVAVIEMEANSITTLELPQTGLGKSSTTIIFRVKGTRIELQL